MSDSYGPPTQPRGWPRNTQVGGKRKIEEDPQDRWRMSPWPGYSIGFCDRPNAWIRFWQWALLGVRWRADCRGCSWQLPGSCRRVGWGGRSQPRRFACLCGNQMPLGLFWEVVACTGCGRLWAYRSQDSAPVRLQLEEAADGNAVLKIRGQSGDW